MNINSLQWVMEKSSTAMDSYSFLQSNRLNYIY